MVEDVERAHVGWAFRFEDVHASEAGGDNGEERRLAAVEEAVDDRCCDVRLAAAAGAGEDEPAGWCICEGLGVFDAAVVLLLVACGGAAATGDEGAKREARERAD